MKEINLNEKYNMKVVKGEEKMSTENKILMLYQRKWNYNCVGLL